MNKQPREGGLPVIARVGIIAGAVLLAAVIGVSAYGLSLMNQDTIYPNVYVAGIHVGGFTREDAIAAIEDTVTDAQAVSTLTVRLPDRTLELDPEITNVALNADEAADSALRYGRDRGPIKAVITYLVSKNTEHTIDLNSSLNLDTEYIRKVIDEAAQDAKSDYVESTLTFDEEAETITVVTGTPEIRLDADGLYEAVMERFSANDLSPLTFEYDIKPCQAVDLQSYYDEYCVEMKEAYYDEKTHELVPEVNGYGFDLPYYTQQIAMAEPGTTFTIRMQPMIPEMTLEQLEKEYFSHTLASYSSWHTAIPARTNNLDLACKAINGTILNPGEEFSFNGIVGERTEAKGYLPATVYLDGGKSQAETGGGICQVASVIYECTLYANLEVTERAPHMFEVTYIDRGQDATIYWGQQDFKFKNSTNHPIRIDAKVADGQVHIALMGTKEELDYDRVSMTYSVLSTKPWKTVGVLTADAPKDEEIELTLLDEPGYDAAGNEVKLVADPDGVLYQLGQELVSPYTGANVAVYRNFLDANGKVLRTESLGTSSYNHRDRKCLITLYEEPIPDDPFYDPDDPFYDPDDPSYDPDDPFYDPDDPFYDPDEEPDESDPEPDDPDDGDLIDPW